MSPRQRSVFALLLLGCVACGRPRAPAPGPHGKPPSEAELGRVTLTAEAEARLGIPEGLAKVERSKLAARRLLGGKVMPVPGCSALVVAPQAGAALLQYQAGVVTLLDVITAQRDLLAARRIEARLTHETALALWQLAAALAVPVI